MQIRPVSSPVVTMKKTPVINAPVQFSGFKFPGADKLKNVKNKLTPDYETKRDLKTIGVGSAVAITGVALAPLIPLAPVATVVGTVALWGGVWFASSGVFNILRRKS
jgi:hypothetical protein